MSVATTAFGDEAIQAADTSAAPPNTAMTAEQRWIQPRALGLPMRSATVSARPWGRSSTTGVTISSGVASTLGSARSKVGLVAGAEVRAFRTSPVFGGRAGRQAVAGRDDAALSLPSAVPTLLPDNTGHRPGSARAHSEDALHQFGLRAAQ